MLVVLAGKLRLFALIRFSFSSLYLMLNVYNYLVSNSNNYCVGCLCGTQRISNGFFFLFSFMGLLI